MMRDIRARLIITFVSLTLMASGFGLRWDFIAPMHAEPPKGTYRLVVDETRDLGTLPGHTWSEARDINQFGRIVGTSAKSEPTRRAVYWSAPTAAPLNMGTLGGAWSEARAVSDQNVSVVGNSVAAGSTVQRGFKWSPPGPMVDLGLVGRVPIGHSAPVKDFSAEDINVYGTVVGNWNAVSPPGYEWGGGYVLERSGTAWYFPNHCDGVIGASVSAINDAGEFTGQVKCTLTTHMQAYLATLTDLLPLRSLADGHAASGGAAINSAGHVAGWTQAFAVPPPSATLRQHAFLWKPTTGMVDLHPPGDTVRQSVAQGLNAFGLVVGYQHWGSGLSLTHEAFVHGQGLAMTKLPGLCPSGSGQSAASAVNDYGWVVGGSSTCSGEYHATFWRVRVVWVPAP
jgi:probable HAF family extracellular repeat protein